MVKRESTAPFLFFILDLPSGISSGFASITLPFILTQAGFSVAAAGYIVALGVSANLWRFLWGPVADFTLSARRWYLIGLVTTAVTLLLLGLIPLRPDSTGLLNAVVFISQVASTLVMLPLGGLMAHTVSDIGAGGMSNLWAAVAPDWHAADTVALVGGVLNGIISAVGCVVGGWVADRIGIWWAYFGSGVAIAIVALVMAIASRTPDIFSSGVLVYAFSQGLAYATFSAIVLVAIGRGAASTKYAALSSLGNLPVVYMTALDGWVHDKYGTSWMLHFDALSGIVCIIVAMFVLKKIKATPR